MATETKVKKKIFITIVAPKIFNEQIIGETPLTDPRSLLGKNMRINLMSITNDPRDQNVEIKLNINSLNGASVRTEMVGYNILPAHIRKLIRKEKRRVDDSFTVKTADNKTVTIKSFLLTIHITPRSVLTALRKKLQEIVKAESAKLTFEALAMEVLSRKLQDRLRKDLAKIYPLKNCEIRTVEIVTGDKKNPEVAVEAIVPVVEQKEIVAEPVAEQKEVVSEQNHENA